MSQFIRSLDVSKFELTRSMVNLLGAVTFEPPVRTGGWERSKVFRAAPVIDSDMPADYYMSKINGPVGFLIPEGCRLQCRSFYPEDGGVDWHTDSSRPGWRLYVYRYRSGDGLFRYADLRFIETGYGAYVFKVGEHCWHCLSVTGERLSIGLEIPPSMAMNLLS